MQMPCSWAPGQVVHLSLRPISFIVIQLVYIVCLTVMIPHLPLSASAWTKLNLICGLIPWPSGRSSALAFITPRFHHNKQQQKFGMSRAVNFSRGFNEKQLMTSAVLVSTVTVIINSWTGSFPIPDL